MNPNRNLTLLHGTLDVSIHSARGLPNMDWFSESLRQCVTAFDACKNVIPSSEKITSDPYVCIVLGDATVARTHVISNTTDPCWEQHFKIPVAHSVEEVEFQVKDNDIIGSDFIASVKIPAATLMSAKIANRTYSLTNKDGKKCRNGAQLTLSLEYHPVEQNHSPPHLDHAGVRGTYFSQRGGSLTLYQDAHLPDDLLPNIDLENGIQFQHNKCWDDIYSAIRGACNLVYIAGWSIYTKVRLLRNNNDNQSSCETLGELLKQKAEQNHVRVLLLVWDDNTSSSVLQNEGIMGTHDEKTRKYFKHSKVHCLVAPRRAHKRISWFKKKVVETLYSHHQKLVLVDAACPVKGKHIIAFLGGLDLCKGRYDTPQHFLFTDLNTTFKDDCYNKTFTRAENGGPRQPWHDLHCKIEGGAAYDVLKSFEQFWLKSLECQKPITKLKRSIRGYPDFLANLDLGQSDQHSCSCDENSSKSWRIQVFRSIDSGSAAGFPKSTKDMQDENLVGGKNIAIDMGIHQAYVEAIRSAQHFIYLENQYFIGSSFNWPSHKRAGSNHLIPIEIALKISKKIKNGEEFAVYIVIPLWPEGVPNSLPIQKLLYFQSQTIEMMYGIIAKALEEENLNAQYHPTDFLNFFCLGNREKEAGDENILTRDFTQASAQKARRFMIYVHSKGMIVDDEYLIIGSANINQRSMAGSRDTEIAIGAFQPNHRWISNKGAPKGQIYGYRMSLWSEHLGLLDDCFQQPWTSACVKKVQKLAKENWTQYIAQDVNSMKGHLMPYPIKVDASGKVESLLDFDSFPDVGGRILGTNNDTIPDSLVA